MVNFGLEKKFFLCYNLYKKRLFVSLKQIGGGKFNLRRNCYERFSFGLYHRKSMAA